MDNFTQKLAFAIKQSGLKQIEIAKKNRDFKTMYHGFQNRKILSKYTNISFIM